jgi:hypothetical protein
MRHFSQRTFSEQEAVVGHDAVACAEEVVEPQPIFTRTAPRLRGAVVEPVSVRRAAQIPRVQENTGMKVGSGSTQCGALRNSRLRSSVDWATSPNSPVSRYFKPPWISRDGAALVPDPKSALSTIRQSTPCTQRSRNTPAPFTPAPKMTTSISLIVAKLLKAAVDCRLKYRSCEIVLLNIGGGACRI